MKHGFLRGGSIGICLLVLFSIFPCQIFAIGTSASSAILMDVDSGRVLYEQNADARMRIASTTKIMTALVAVEQGDLSRIVTVRREETLAEGSSMYLRAGEKLTLEALLYGLLLCSGNDAALAVADAVGGSESNFVALMNARAKELGMTNTSFANPNGLDDAQHYSTARDMARLACAAAGNRTLMRIASTRTVTVGGRTMTNHNKLLGWVDGCIGLKTGYTRAAGRTLVSCVRRNGQQLVAVTLQDGNDWVDHEALYEYGFSAYPARTALTVGETVRRMTVTGGLAASVPIVAGEAFAWPVGAGETLQVTPELPDGLAAPVRAGARAGEAVVTLDGREVGRIPLLCGADVPAALPEPISFLHSLQNFLRR